MKPRLLLHVCCAPDEAWVVHTLGQSHTLYCFFCNPNISPEPEYRLRCAEAHSVAERFGIPFTADCYEPDLWEEAVAPALATPEGGERCTRCFALRLRRTARFCREIGFPEFTTVMSVSPHKRISMLNEAGSAAGAECEVSYARFDFKKKDGFKKSVALSRDLGLYRQDYCGCRLSREERELREKRRSGSG